MPGDSGKADYEWIRRSLTLAILLGLLLVPATCSHAMGPHSLFIDPRTDTRSSHADHAGHDEHHHARDDDAKQSTKSDFEATRTPTVNDLPSSMLISIASNVVAIDLPHLLSIPAASGPESVRSLDVPTGIEIPVDVPPPRDLQF